MKFTISENDTGQRLYKKAKMLIPGGTQLLSKRPEMFLPDLWPSYYTRAKGAEVWDLDGKRFLDMSYCGIGSTVLGYADPEVNAAVREAIEAGSMSTLNNYEEVELAELLCELHPWAQMVRFGRCGGEAMAIAVRIARAKTGRDKVAFCGYHGWHDWYLAANLKEEGALDDHLLPGLEPVGVPRGLLSTALPFHYNRIEELKTLVDKHSRDIAAIVMEPMRGQPPIEGFLEGIKQIAHDIGAVLIFDEVTSGWRINTGGVHLKLGINPDIAVFAKAMGNGFPMAAIIGIARVMEAAQKSFISSTYWTERVGPVAALAMIRKHRSEGVPGHLVHIGASIKEVWRRAAEANKLPIHISGMDPLAHFSIDCPESQSILTLFNQLMLERGFLATKSFYAMFAHRKEHVEAYSKAVDEVFGILAEALRKDQIVKLLKGPVAHSGFARLT